MESRAPCRCRARVRRRAEAKQGHWRARVHRAGGPSNRLQTRTRSHRRDSRLRPRAGCRGRDSMRDRSESRRAGAVCATSPCQGRWVRCGETRTHDCRSGFHRRWGNCQFACISRLYGACNRGPRSAACDGNSDVVKAVPRACRRADLSYAPAGAAVTVCALFPRLAPGATVFCPLKRASPRADHHRRNE